jgi:hypothetical protein
MIAGVVLLLAGCERVVPSLYIGPETLDGRKELYGKCFSNSGYIQDQKKSEIIDDCRNLVTEIYGVAGFKYVRPTLDYGLIDRSRTLPCEKAKKPAEKKVCLN